MDDVGVLIAEGRVEAEALMVDTCEVRLPSAAGPMDPDTGEVPLVPGAVVYGPLVAPYFGKFKIPVFSRLSENIANAGGVVFVSRLFPVVFPVDAPKIIEGYLIEVVASRYAEHNVGRRFRVSSQSGASIATAQHVNVEELVGAVQS